MSGPGLIELTPLDQIRHTEAECARRIALARAAVEEAEGAARIQAARLVQEAHAEGRRAGAARRKVIISEAEEEACTIAARGQTLAADLRARGKRRMAEAVQQAIILVLGQEPEAEE